MIKINNLIHNYDDVTALNIENLEIKDNSIVGLTGVNGCGKSTLLRILAGVYQPTSGEVYVDAKPLYENIDVKKDILFINDDPFSNLSIKELIDFYTLFYNMDITSFHKYLALFEIKKEGSLAKFSKGMRRRVYLSIALAISPKILLLDEAFDGLDSIAKQTFKEEIIKQIDEKEMTVIIASHSLKDINDLVDELILLKNGKVISSGESNNTMKRVSVCFDKQHTTSDFSHQTIIDIKGDKKIFNIITNEDEKLITYLKTFNPLILETTELSFEEIFFYKNKEVSQ